MDPVVIHNTVTDGYIAFINQSIVPHTVDRAQVTTEFINNWVSEKLPAATPVETRGKLAVTWGRLKRKSDTISR